MWNEYFMWNMLNILLSFLPTENEGNDPEAKQNEDGPAPDPEVPTLEHDTTTTTTHTTATTSRQT